MKPSASQNRKIISFYNKALKDKNHRFRSWEHCYKHFSENHDDHDLAALNLGFYLASWGMYRGSTFSLQKDYKIHIDCVHELKNITYGYEALRNASPESYINSPEKIELLFQLKEKIKICYKPYTINKNKNEVTDTLITKILLGTLGCVPAYDRIFKDGLKRCKLPQSFTERSFLKLMEQLILEQQIFKKMEMNLKTDGFNYPVMKQIDMYYWALGLSDNDDEEKYLI